MKRTNVPAITLIAVLLLSTVLRAQTFSPEVRAFIKIPPGTIAITDVKLIDGSGGPAKEHQTVLIENDRITAVGDSKSIPLPPNAVVVNGTGKTVIPGLVMLHEHLYYTNPLEDPDLE